MRILADENIPWIRDYFGSYGELVLKPGRHLQRDDVASVDMLILRSVTKVNRELLENTAVKFVGCVSTGSDHIDKAWLDKAGIPWAVAEGTNAIGVVQYVVAVIAALQEEGILLDRKPLRAGVIGVGRIGSQVVTQLKLLGFDVIQNDPFRAEQEPDFVSVPLEDFHDLDLITIHTPLTRDGSHPTFHLIKKEFLQRQKKNTVLINASRGSVIDFSDLKEYGESFYWCLDVWENEPMIDFEVLELAEIASPHIAGHTIQGKYRAIESIFHAACHKGLLPSALVSTIPIPRTTLSLDHHSVSWRDVILKIYDPRQTTHNMKNTVIEDGSGKVFDALRNHFPDRYEFQYVTLLNAKMDDATSRLLTAMEVVIG